MGSSRIEIEYANALSLPDSAAGELGASFETIGQSLPQHLEKVLSAVEANELGFWDIEGLRSSLPEVTKVTANVPAGTTDVLVLGIGGSSLGPRAMYEALCGPAHLRLPNAGRRLYFPDNSDPWKLAGLLSKLTPERTLVVVISKSGSTLETVATYLVVEKWLQNALGETRASAHTTVVTTPSQAPLRQLASSKGIACLEVPENVGGRFSVLTQVGQLPAMLAGMDIDGVLRGAARMRTICERRDLHQNPAAILAALNITHQRFGRSISVLMPYADALRAFSAWWAQLWAESLGKRHNRSGEVIETGMTALTAVGATDQHSQLQLFAHGPDDKLITLIQVTNAEQSLEIPITSGPFGYLGGQSLQDVLHAEQRATELALRAVNRPSLRITLPDLHPESLGELFFLFQAATALSGELLDINAFDQPGVEVGKRLTSAIIGRPGFDDELRQIRDWDAEPRPRAYYRDESSFSHDAE